jgi:Protein of unknown function (DUF3750)
MKTLKRILYVLIAGLFMGGGMAIVTAQDWRTASREPVGTAPDPKMVREAIVQVYGARAVGAKGYFGVHTWIAVKPTEAPSWTVYEVIGWRLRYGDNVVVMRERAPDARWFGSEPELYADRRGAGVDGLIKRIDQAARSYPYAGEYSVWPGPNSNTFTSWVARAVPELAIDLPPTAIGKDYLRGEVFASAPSGRGYQLSLRGLLGVAASPVEGFELNLLGLSIGVGPSGLKLPLVGTLGPSRSFASAPVPAANAGP